MCLQLYWPLLQTRWDERCAPAWASCVGLSRPLCTGLWVAEMMTMKNKVLPLVSQGLISAATLLFLSLIFVIVTWSAPACLIVTLCGFVMIDRTHSSFCGSMNVKGLVAEDAAHLKLNGSLCKQTYANPTLFPYTQLFPALAVNGWVDNGCDLCEDVRLFICAISFFFSHFGFLLSYFCLLSLLPFIYTYFGFVLLFVFGLTALHHIATYTQATTVKGSSMQRHTPASSHSPPGFITWQGHCGVS